MGRARLNLEIPDSVRQRLDELKEEAGVGTITEVIRRALAVYDAALREETSGGRVLLESAEGQIRQLLVR